ncbi:MAG: hypothetical protein ACOC2E_04755 [Bacteroidota bacterium]
MEKQKETTTVKTIHTVERFGWLTKEEPLKTLYDSNLHLGITIFESTSPFFGYYDDQPNTEKPRYLYWVLDQYYPLEKITRVLCDLRENFSENLDLAPGNIFIANEMYFVFRMINLEKYNLIHQIQVFMENAGIRLKKGPQRIREQMSIIYLNKFLHLQPVSNGFYIEKENTQRGYFRIPRNIEWKEFKTITQQVKFNTPLIFFDAARAAFMENGKIVELIRVYRENLSLENLEDIRNVYLKFI